MDKNTRSLLPGYINQTLPEKEWQHVEAALNQGELQPSELAAWKQVQGALKSQPQQVPAVRIRQQLMSRIQAQPIFLPESAQRSWVWRLLSYVALVFSIFLLLLVVVQPGVMLEWSAGEAVDAFRIYRLNAGQASYELVGEMAAQPGLSHYNFVDAWFLPWQRFTYIVEGVNEQGQAALSQAVTGNALSALPGQIALLLSSVILAGIMRMAVSRLEKSDSKNRPMLLA
jgi:hypothetical protein